MCPGKPIPDNSALRMAAQLPVPSFLQKFVAVHVAESRNEQKPVKPGPQLFFARSRWKFPHSSPFPSTFSHRLGALGPHRGSLRDHRPGPCPAVGAVGTPRGSLGIERTLAPVARRSDLAKLPSRSFEPWTLPCSKICSTYLSAYEPFGTRDDL